MRKLRIVVDASSIVSASFGGVSLQALTVAFSHQVFISKEVKEEILSLPQKLSRKIGKDKSEKIYLLLTELLRLAQEIEVKSKITICRDPSDNKYLELCLDSKANFLITYDKDLLELSQTELESVGLKDLKIVKPSEFLLLLK